MSARLTNGALERALVCIVSGLDVRALDAGRFGFAGELAANYASARIRTAPSTDQIASLLTGLAPHEHGMWGPRLHRGGEPNGRLRMIDRLPDLLTTTAQCAVHVLRGPVDGATMPPRRRRRFEWRRFKAIRNQPPRELAASLSDRTTLLSAVGIDDSRYLFSDSLSRLDHLLASSGNGDLALEIVDAHGFDRLLHWHMDAPAIVEKYSETIDQFVRELHDKCRRNGVAFVLLSEHGMEPVGDYGDLFAELAQLDLSRDAYDVYVENTKATFWFHTADARRRVIDRLSALEWLTVLDRQELARYGVAFDTSEYGDAFAYAQPGWNLFPNDFYQPFANAVLALSDWQQRPRLRNPRHRGDHGYLSEHPSEIGLLMLAQDGFRARTEEIEVHDIAPTLLALLGRPTPPQMQGQPAFHAITRSSSAAS